MANQNHTPMKAKLIQCIDNEWFSTEVEIDNILPAFEIRGYTFSHINHNPRQLPKLQGLPVFRELVGPCNEGEFGVRYEDSAAYEHLST